MTLGTLGFIIGVIGAALFVWGQLGIRKCDRELSTLDDLIRRSGVPRDQAWNMQISDLKRLAKERARP